MQRIDETDSNERAPRSLPRLLAWDAQVAWEKGWFLYSDTRKIYFQYASRHGIGQDWCAKRQQQPEGGNSPAILVTLAIGAAMRVN
jgi:hypothetical protein